MKNTLLATILVFSSLQIFAWGKSAHQIIGQLADQYLTAKTREEVKKILGEESLSNAGIWMDVMVSPKEYKVQEHWHYAYKDVVHADNAMVKMTEFTATLKSAEATAEDKLFAMRAFVHIAQDVHNPIHCGYEDDHGGHNTKITWVESGKKSNLHKVWDTDLIEMSKREMLAYVDYLQGQITLEDKEKWSTGDFQVWVTESQDYLAQVYDFKGKTLDENYYKNNITVLDDRLSMAAVRLAFVLNNIFDPK